MANLDQITQFCLLVFGEGATEGNVAVCRDDDEVLFSRDPEEIAAFVADQPAWVSPQTRDDAGEAWEQAATGTPLVRLEDAPKPPDVLLRHESGDLFGIWLLETVNLRENPVELAQAFPLPGAGGWTIVDAEAVTPAEAPKAEPIKLNDAVLYGMPNDAILNRQIEIGFSAMGRRTGTGQWRNTKTDVRGLLTSLSKHEIGDKDGKCFLQGAALGGDRKANAIKHLDLLVLDLDTGESIAAVRARLEHLGLFGVIYTTHSHLKPITDTKKDAVIKHMGDGAEHPTVDDVSRYLMDTKRYRPEILEGAVLLGTEHTPDGVMLRLQHKPMPKFRVLLVLKERFVIADRASTQKEAITEWKERYAGASKLLGAFFDRSCVDLSRLFYTPRHPKGASAYSIEVVPGRPLDIEEVERISAHEVKQQAKDAFAMAAEAMGSKGSGEYKTSNMLYFFKKYGDRFEVDDFLLDKDPDGDRGSRSSGIGRTHKCPNDDSHTNAGDEEDVGFFCVNASDGETAVAHCQHDSCSTLDRINFVDLICAREKITDAMDLKNWIAEGVDDEDEEEQEEEKEPEAAARPVRSEMKPWSNSGEVKLAVSSLHKGDAEGAEDVAYRIGLTGFSAATEELLLKALSKQSGVSLRSLAEAVKLGDVASRPEGSEALGDDARSKLAEINKKYALVTVGSKVRILMEPEKSGEAPTLYTVDDWRNKMMNEKAKQSVDGEEKMVPAAKLWMEWAERRDYDTLVFDPKIAPNTHGKVYNLWKGWPLKAKQGDWSLLREHLFENICLGNEANFNWLMTWVAQIFQHPGVKMGSAVAIKGVKGTGKSIFWDWVRRAMGDHATKVSQRAHITGNFNSHQLGKVLITAEEAFWAADSSAGGVLKDLITSDSMQMERKGVDAIEVASYVRLVFISNEAWVVPAGLEDERRFFVLECGSARRGDIDYFEAIRTQMERGGLEAMLHEFMNWKPEGNNWNVLRKPPRTPWLVEQGLESLDIWSRFFLQMIGEGGMMDDDAPGGDSILLDEEKVTFVPVALMRWYFEKFISRTTHGKYKVGDPNFMDRQVEAWLLALPSKYRHQTGFNAGKQTCYVIRPMAEVRAHLHKTKGIEFSEVIDSEQMAA